MKTISIQPKRDFGSVGYFINGKYVRKGWLAVYRGCNIMNGAGWFFTKKEGLAWKKEHGAKAMRQADKVLLPYDFSKNGVNCGSR